MSRRLRFEATSSSGEVSGILECPGDAVAVYVLAHGAGAGMEHPFMGSMAARLAARRVGTLRYQFPYMEQGKKRPGPPAVDQKAVASAVAAARSECGLPVVAGGKSYGGRMTAYAAAEGLVEGVAGLVFLGFPLHPPGKPGSERWEPMTRVGLPMLFLQGTRDSLAKLELLRPLLQRLEPAGDLHVIDDGDHSFRVPQRAGRSADEVMDELADVAAAWIVERTAGPS